MVTAVRRAVATSVAAPTLVTTSAAAAVCTVTGSTAPVLWLAMSSVRPWCTSETRMS